MKNIFFTADSDLSPLKYYAKMQYQYVKFQIDNYNVCKLDFKLVYMNYCNINLER